MSHRFVSVLAVALLVAAMASMVLYRLMARPTSAPLPALSVLVAARDLPVGTLIKEPDLRAESHTGRIPAGAARHATDLVGRGVIAAIYKDEVVLDNRLAGRGAGAGLAAMIPAGKRAAAVRVNEVVGVAGFVLPGMRVDILMSGVPPGGGSTGSITRTLLQNIEVLSAGQNYQKDAEGKPVLVQVVNLLVTPEQAEVLSLASNQATIQLVLRNPLDGNEANPPGAVMAALYGKPARAPVERAPARPPRPVRVAEVRPKPEPPSVVVEMIHGIKKAEERFPAGERP